MKSVSGRYLCKVLENHDWVLRRVRGSHNIFAKEGNPSILTVPVHGNRDLKLGLLRRLLKDAGITEQDL